MGQPGRRDDIEDAFDALERSEFYHIALVHLGDGTDAAVQRLWRVKTQAQLDLLKGAFDQI